MHCFFLQLKLGVIRIKRVTDRLQDFQVKLLTRIAKLCHRSWEVELFENINILFSIYLRIDFDQFVHDSETRGSISLYVIRTTCLCESAQRWSNL